MLYLALLLLSLGKGVSLATGGALLGGRGVKEGEQERTGRLVLVCMVGLERPAGREGQRASEVRVKRRRTQ